MKCVCYMTGVICGEMSNLLDAHAGETVNRSTVIRQYCLQSSFACIIRVCSIVIALCKIIIHELVAYVVKIVGCSYSH